MSEEETELKPCPFCGSTPVSWTTSRSHIGCESCDYSIRGFPVELVEENWNTRTPGRPEV